MTKSLTVALVSDKGRVELSREEAEGIKKHYGIPRACTPAWPAGRPQYVSARRREGETRWKEEKISRNQVLSLMRPWLEQLANEIERSLDFYREESHGGKVDRIFLFGGGARLKGLKEFLADELGMDVIVGHFPGNINVRSGTVPAEGQDEDDGKTFPLNLAIGAALEGGNRCGFFPGKGINLLPVAMKEETRRFVQKVSLEAIATGILVSLFIFYAGVRLQRDAYKKKLAAARMERRSLAPRLQKLREKMLISQILQDKPYWDEVLKEISHLVPPNVYLTDLTMKNNIVHFKGMITQKDQRTQVTLPHFMMTLERSLFKNVALVTTRKMPSDAATAEFEIKCEIE